MTKLNICDRLLSDFHDQEIVYCHWKSNEHLLEGLAGATDLDIIVKDRKLSERILQQNGFKRFEPSCFIRYPGLEDYIGYDPETGDLVHVHLHHRLAIGNKRLKDYHLPWLDVLFKRRVFDDENEVYRADPAMEMVLLLVRYALKIQKRDYIKSVFEEYLSEDVIREYNWLRERADNGEVNQLASDLLNEEAGDIMESILASKPRLRQFRKLRSVCTEELSQSRTYGYIESQARGLFREIFLGCRSLTQQYFDQPRFYRRTVPSGGAHVILLGVDGAGKSTLIKELEEWLSWKLDIQRIYYGSGDGAATRLRYPIIAVRKRIGGEVAATSNNSTSERSFLMRIGRILRSIVLARERHKKLQKGWRARNRGLVVLGDRYPQNQIMGFNDGPLLDHLSDSSSQLLQRLASWEQTVYHSAESRPPNLVIKLDISPETARERKPEMSIDQLEKRVKAVESIEYDTNIVIVNAEQPQEDVLKEVKQHIWERL